METKAKLSKKILSTFLAVLMIFSACYVGINGAYTAYAAEGDSDYTVDEVAALINAATAGGFTLSSSGDVWNYAADDGKVIAAAEAIFDYAVNTYRDGKEATSAANSSKGLYDKFDATFSSKYTNATAARQLVKNVLNPDGTTVYSYENPGKKTGVNGAESTTSMSAGTDVTSTYPVASYPSYYASSNTGVITKTSTIALDLNKYLMTFAKIEDIPSTIITGVKYIYAHTYSSSAKVTKVTTRDETTGSGCNASTTTYYTPVMETTYWNYMSGKPTREVTKDKTIRKGLLTLEKYFNEELLATTFEEMLAMDVDKIKSLYLTTETMYESMSVFSDAVLSHFGLNPSAIHNFMDTVDYAYRIVAAKYNVDILNTLIGTEYDVESYAEMSALYAKTSTAYNVVYSMDAEIINYICSEEGGYAEQYESAMALKATAESYNAVLFDIMTEQKLEETVEAMVATYTDYINVLNKEDIDNPSDAEVIGLKQKVEAFDAIIASYTGYSYYRNYWTTDYEAAWATFKGKLNEVYEVRGLKMEFETYYSYFLPLIYTTQMDTLDNEALISLHADLDTKLAELRASYNDVVSKWGGTIADKIFTTVYEGSPYLLQTLVESVKSTGKEAAKNLLIARTEAQLDAVYAYKDTTVVNFDNFASIKSTLTYFDYDLYNYVNGGGEGQNKWLSTDYTNKYSMVQTLLDRYHAFSTSDGKSYFDESFTFAEADGTYATRYAGSKLVTGTDENGEAIWEEIGYPTDIARGGDEDTYVVTAEKMNDTVTRMDKFITSRDFGAIIGLVSTETDEYCDLATYVTEMLNEMLYNDDLINTLVGAIYPMIVDLLNTELVGMLADMGENDDPTASACIDLSELDDTASGDLYVYMDGALFKGQHKQRYFSELFAEAGLYIYPETLADSLMMSNPVAFGKGTPIYTALKAAGRDWTQLVCADDPETTEDETKVLDFEWGVYDAETFTDMLACVFDSLLPLLNAILTGKNFSTTLDNAAYCYTTNLKYIVSIGTGAIFGHLVLNIPALTVYSDVLAPLFEILGVEEIPTLKQNASGDDLAKAIVKPLLGTIDRILENPVSEILGILPNLVYFISMDTIQEMLNSLVISLDLTIETEVDKDNSGTLIKYLGDTLLGLLGDMFAFDVPLNVADMIDLYDMLGFEISDFNEILAFAIPMLGIEGLTLPPIKQQEIIFCADWSNFASGRVNLEANKSDLMYWLLNYVVSALTPDENGNSLLTALLGSDMDPMVAGIIEGVVESVTTNPRGFLAALIELLNPAEKGTYELVEMNWVENEFNYGEIEGATQMSIVYLNYGDDWTREKADYLNDNIVTLVDAIMEMIGVDFDINGIGTMLTDTVNGLFTNANITALVEMLGGLGDSPSAIIADIIGNQVGIELESWFTAFGYLFPAETWAEDAEIIPLGHRNYVNDFGVEGIANEDGTISWYFNRMPLIDGDGYTFVNILSRLLGPAKVLIEFLFAGGDVTAFESLLTLHGYESYAASLGIILEMLGIQNLPTQADFNADAMGAFTNMLHAVLDWFYALAESDDMIQQVIALIPNLFYFIESNGLSVVLHNLLMPVWVLVDTVRPLIDVDVNGALSLLVSELLNGGELDINVILNYVLTGVLEDKGADYKYYAVDINNLTFTKILEIVDQYLGTALAASGLVEVGIKGFCSGTEKVENAAVGELYRSTIDSTDTITILVTALLDCLTQPAADATKTNAEVLLAGLGVADEETAGMVAAIIELIKGIEVTYEEPDWGYNLKGYDLFTAEGLKPSISYLEYTTDWTEESAKSIYAALDDVLDMFLPDLLGEDTTIAALVNGILADNVYSDEILNTIVEGLVNLLAGINKTLVDTIGVMLDADINAWFAMCEEQTDAETGETKLVCTKDWGIDEAEDKGAAFKAAIMEVLAPADELLKFVFFGESFNFFTGSEKDADGNYTYKSIININGIEGYERTFVPIFRALGLQLPSAAELNNSTSAAVGAIFDALFGLIEKLATTESAVKVVFELLPNLIYFINADGLKTSVNNLLIPVNNLLEKVGPVAGQELTIDALLGDMLPEGLVLTDLSTDALLELAAGFGFKVSNETVDYAELIKTLYVGKLTAYDYADGLTGYTLDVTGAEHDVLTIVLSLAIELFTCNDELFSELLGAEMYNAIVNIIGGAEVFVYDTIDWDYMYGEVGATFTTTPGAAQFLPNYAANDTSDYSAVINYLKYANNWNEETADYVLEVLDGLVQSFFESDNSLGLLLDKAIAKGLYQDSILEELLELVVGLIYDYAELIEAAGGLLGAESISKWWTEYCTVEKDENGNNVVTVIKDFGIDEAETIDEKRVKFVDAFTEVLEPAYDILAWLLFGEDFTFFTSSETNEDGSNKPLITIQGGEGYAKGLAPLFEAVGAKMPNARNGYAIGNYIDGNSGLIPVEEFYKDADGNALEAPDMKYAVESVFYALTDWLHMICGKLNADEEGETVANNLLTTMLELLPNVIYNLNAGTLDAVVNNLLMPVEAILTELGAFGVELDIKALLADLGIKSLDWYGVFSLVEELVHLYWPENIQNFLANLYLGKLVAYTSASGDIAYYTTYTTAEEIEKAEKADEKDYLDTSIADMTTIVISFVLDGVLDERNSGIGNDGKLSRWLGEDIYKVIMAYLTKKLIPVEMADFTWLIPEVEEEDGTETPIEPGDVVTPETLGGTEALYGKHYTKEQADYINKWLPSFVDTAIVLIGVQNEDGEGYKGLEDILTQLIGTTIYTKANLEAILGAIQGLLPTLKEALDADLYDIIENVLLLALDIDLTHFENYVIADFEDGDREAFITGLVEMLRPLVPVLEWLLTEENLIALFNTADGQDAIVVAGAEGYAYGIIPLLEALVMTIPESAYEADGVDYVGSILTPDEFAAACKADRNAESDAKNDALLRNILNPILNVVDYALKDPVNRIFDILPGIIYFLNSNGLDTVIRNVLNAVLVVLKNIEPLVGEITVEDLYEMVGFNAAEINIESILAELLEGLEEDSCLEFSELAMDAIKDLTVGQLYEFTSKNGKQAYTMRYAEGADRPDMVTTVLTAGLEFIAVEENAEALKALLADANLGEDGYEFACALLDNFVQMCESEGGTDQALYTIYEVFYTANVAVHVTEDTIGEFNGDYSFLNDMFENSNLGFIQDLGSSLSGLLNKYVGDDVIDDTGLAPNGLVAFFQKIAEFFQKIGDFFKNLFG